MVRTRSGFLLRAPNRFLTAAALALAIGVSTVPAFAQEHEPRTLAEQAKDRADAPAVKAALGLTNYDIIKTGHALEHCYAFCMKKIVKDRAEEVARIKADNVRHAKVVKARREEEAQDWGEALACGDAQNQIIAKIGSSNWRRWKSYSEFRQAMNDAQAVADELGHIAVRHRDIAHGVKMETTEELDTTPCKEIAQNGLAYVNKILRLN